MISSIIFGNTQNTSTEYISINKLTHFYDCGQSKPFFPHSYEDNLVKDVRIKPDLQANMTCFLFQCHLTVQYAFLKETKISEDSNSFCSCNKSVQYFRD